MLEAKELLLDFSGGLGYAANQQELVDKKRASTVFNCIPTKYGPVLLDGSQSESAFTCGASEITFIRELGCNTQFVFAWNGTTGYKWDGTTVTPCTSNPASVKDACTYGYENNVFVGTYTGATNIKLLTDTGTAFTAPTALPTEAGGAETCCTWGGYVVLGNISGGSGTFKRRLLWAAAGTTDFVGTGSGYMDLSDLPGEIYRLVRYKDDLFIITSYAIYLFQYVGSPKYWNPVLITLLDATLYRSSISVTPYGIACVTSIGVGLITNTGISYISEAIDYGLSHAFATTGLDLNVRTWTCFEANGNCLIVSDIHAATTDGTPLALAYDFGEKVWYTIYTTYTANTYNATVGKYVGRSTTVKPGQMLVSLRGANAGKVMVYPDVWGVEVSTTHPTAQIISPFFNLGSHARLREVVGKATGTAPTVIIYGTQNEASTSSTPYLEPNTAATNQRKYHWPFSTVYDKCSVAVTFNTGTIPFDWYTLYYHGR